MFIDIIPLQKNTARLTRVYGDAPCAALPASVPGPEGGVLAITELGDYCFSEKPRSLPGADTLCRYEVSPDGTCTLVQAFGRDLTGRHGRYDLDFGEEPAAPEELHPVCGNFVEEIILPDSLQVIGSCAFYNCRSLKTLHFGPALRRVGSDCFTNCFALKTLVLHAVPSAPSGLNKVLARISAPVTVNFYQEQLLAQLFFPEYADDNLENGPAHIFMHEFQGVGYLFRQCFGLGGELRFSEYDACFARAKALETPEVLCRIALGRLRFPAGLADTGAEEYRACCRSQASALASLLLHERDLPGLEFACRECLFSAEALADAAALAAKQNQPQAAALLMQAQKPSRPAPKRYDFTF